MALILVRSILRSWGAVGKMGPENADARTQGKNAE